MNNPELYLQSNQISKRDSQQVLQDFVESINWHPDGCDSLLDAGCGPGDVTMDIVLPFLPPSFERLVGVDISHEMISYARKTRIHPKLSFEQFNLNIEFEKQSLCNVEPFDHIFSCYVLRMVPNVKMCLENFYKLLKPDGDMLLLFNRCSYNHAIYLELSNNSKWSKYLADEKIYHAPNFDWYGPPEAFRNLLNECGFSKCDIRVYQNTYNESYETVRNLIQSISTFLVRIPDEDKEAFIDDSLDVIIKKMCKVLGDLNKNKKGCRLTRSYELYVVYARK